MPKGVRFWGPAGLVLTAFEAWAVATKRHEWTLSHVVWALMERSRVFTVAVAGPLVWLLKHFLFDRPSSK